MKVRAQLKSWFLKNQRDLPWRKPQKSGFRNPYHTWISEIMLQQTQVNTVIDYYNRWLKAFPTLKKLALADEKDVLKLWSGLGYYSRARNILKAAIEIENKYQGKFPQNREDVLNLPGVGEYTAGAILSLAMKQKEPILDGNIIRIFSRYYGINYLPVKVAQKNTYRDKSREWVDCSFPHIINEALMELGALVCVKSHPQCSLCPLQKSCLSFKTGLTEKYPPVKVRKKIEVKQGFAFVIKKDSRYLFTRENNFGVLKGQWMPVGYLTHELNPRRERVAKMLKIEKAVVTMKKGNLVNHHIMHYNFKIRVYHIELPSREKIPVADNFQWFDHAKIPQYVVSAFAKKMMPPSITSL